MQRSCKTLPVFTMEAVDESSKIFGWGSPPANRLDIPALSFCNSCIMGPSDLPDRTAGLRAWVYISGKSQGHVIQLICTMWANSPHRQIACAG